MFVVTDCFKIIMYLFMLIEIIMFLMICGLKGSDPFYFYTIYTYIRPITNME